MARAEKEAAKQQARRQQSGPLSPPQSMTPKRIAPREAVEARESAQQQERKQQDDVLQRMLAFGSEPPAAPQQGADGSKDSVPTAPEPAAADSSTGTATAPERSTGGASVTSTEQGEGPVAAVAQQQGVAASEHVGASEPTAV